MEIPDDLLCLFSARLEPRDDEYVLDVPTRELRHGELDAGDVYRVALLPTEDGQASADAGSKYGTPPVEEGDVREVEIEGIGDQGDGIARVDRGYVVIVPDTDVGDEVAIEIEDLHDNFAIGRVIDDRSGEDAAW